MTYCCCVSEFLAVWKTCPSTLSYSRSCFAVDNGAYRSWRTSPGSTWCALCDRSRRYAKTTVYCMKSCQEISWFDIQKQNSTIVVINIFSSGPWRNAHQRSRAGGAPRLTHWQWQLHQQRLPPRIRLNDSILLRYRTYLIPTIIEYTETSSIGFTVQILTSQSVSFSPFVHDALLLKLQSSYFVGKHYVSENFRRSKGN